MPKPQPPNSDQLLAQLQAYVDSVVAAAVADLGIDAIRSRLDGLEVRTLALEEATPPGTLPGEVRWRQPLVHIEGIPGDVTSSASVTARWVKTSASQSVPAVGLSLDGSVPVELAEGVEYTWADLPVGLHELSAVVNGNVETRVHWRVVP